MATGQNSTVYSVQGLHPFSVYSFKVAAVNGVGLSRESDQSYYMITLREVSWDWTAGHEGAVGDLSCMSIFSACFGASN